MAAKKTPKDKAKTNRIVSLNFDFRFLQVAELCIAGAIAGDDFGNVFKSIETVENINSYVSEINNLQLAAIVDTIIRRIGSNDPVLHKATLQTLIEMFQQSEGRKDSLSFSCREKPEKL